MDFFIGDHFTAAFNITLYLCPSYVVAYFLKYKLGLGLLQFYTIAMTIL